MDSTNYVRDLILEKYKSIRQFALAIHVPYSTIKSGLNAGIGGMAVETVIKMCNALDLRVEDLHKMDMNNENFLLTPLETDLIKKFRQLPYELKQKILLEVERETHSFSSIKT